MADAAAEASPLRDGTADTAGKSEHKRHKEHKKKHKHHKEKRSHRERVEDKSLADDGDHGDAGAKAAPAASPPAAPPGAAATVRGGDDDTEEGELPDAAPEPSPPQERPAEANGGGARRRSDSRDKGRREPSPDRRREERRPEPDRAGSRAARPRSRSPERAPREREEPRREPDRPRPGAYADRSREADRRRFDDRRLAEAWHRRDDRSGGAGGGYDDRNRQRDYGRGGRRSRSRSGSRDGRKRSRSAQRRRQEEEEEVDPELEARVAAALEGGGGEQEEEDRLIEERRRRRAEILAKHRQQQQAAESAAAPTAAGLRHSASAASVPAEGEGEPALSDNDEDAAMAELGTAEGGGLDIWRHDGAAAAAAAQPEEPGQAGLASEALRAGAGEADDAEAAARMHAHAQQQQQAEAEAPDMFAEGEEAHDIFAATPEPAPGAAADAAAGGGAAAPGAARRAGLLDNFDDAEGYYNFQVGEVVGGHYEVFAAHGRGVFSSVLRARDLSRLDGPGGAPAEVAIKVIRSNETMYKAGQMEKVILRKLGEADPAGRRHCIRMLSSFDYRNHLCLVFESMDMNLRELTKRYGRGIGLSISAVRIYAQQMLVALYHLRNCGVLHADIKPDNILVNDRRTMVKLCDFGSAMFSGDNEITPYLVSRFYRAPEVILGLPYDHPMDMWSIGCVLYELFTGRILFPGRTNNEMLKLMMEVKGPFPKKMVKRAEFGFKHFEGDAATLSFAQLEEDPVTRAPVRRLVPNPSIKADFGALLAGQSPDRRKLAQLADLLERMMALDPERRISPKDALRHAFVKEPPGADTGK